MREVLASIVVYLGLVGSLLGAVSLIRPRKILAIATRGHATLVLAAGMVLAVLGLLLPAQENSIAKAETRLDEFFPVYQFHEFHRIRVKAPRERVWSAIREVRADEIFLFRTLTWIRRSGRKSQESILSPSGQAPILEVAAKTSFLLLAEDREREIVLGTFVVAPPGTRFYTRPTPQDFRDLQQPGFAKAAMNFRVVELSSGECEVTTETRVCATDAVSRRKFAEYWRVIYPGSALIRVMWLRAIRKRAEGTPH